MSALVGIPLPHPLGLRYPSGVAFSAEQLTTKYKALLELAKAKSGASPHEADNARRAADKVRLQLVDALNEEYRSLNGASSGEAMRRRSDIVAQLRSLGAETPAGAPSSGPSAGSGGWGFSDGFPWDSFEEIFGGRRAPPPPQPPPPRQPPSAEPPPGGRKGRPKSSRTTDEDDLTSDLRVSQYKAKAHEGAVLGLLAARCGCYVAKEGSRTYLIGRAADTRRARAMIQTFLAKTYEMFHHHFPLPTDEQQGLYFFGLAAALDLEQESFPSTEEETAALNRSRRLEALYRSGRLNFERD
ncbi:MAG: hypothetical protein IT477_10240 [Rhodanobacteraceae bacterium]|nr:hypothetical protein [Rhodanobacteraceae bacterium]